MNEQKAVPNIRFKGFDDEWEDTVLGKFVKVYDGVHQTPKYKNNGVPFVSVENISNLYTNKFISKSDFDNNFKNSKPTSGDLLMTRIGDIGTVNFVKNNNDLAYYVSLALLKPKTKDFKKYMNSYFLMYLIESPRTKKELWKRTLHIAFPKKINKNEISKVNLCICSNWKEQQKIGNLFAKLDKLLGLQRQNIDKLELLKKTLLQKLFPKHDAKIPELRFKGYDHEWKEKKFSSLYKKCNEKNNLSFGNDKIISVANMYYKKDNVKSDDNYMKTYNIFRLGDIAFEGNKSKKFTFGRFVENTIGDGIVSHVFEVFRPISNGDITYWKYAIHNEDFIAPILMKSTVKATMMNNLIAKDFLKQRVPVPQLSEQQKIGNLLSKVDQLIELENKKLHNLQQVKKCLLQNMFVE